MKQYLKSLLIGGMAFFLGNSASAQTRAKTIANKKPVSKVEKQKEYYRKNAGKYVDRLIDERPATIYDASKDFLAYPVNVNYTVDTLQCSDCLNAYFAEAIVVNFDRNWFGAQKDFNKRINSELVHEVLHFIQQEKIKYFFKQDIAQTLTFKQAYELEICREVAAHAADKLADKMDTSKKFDVKEFAKIVNDETKRFLTWEGFDSYYKKQYFNSSISLFNSVEEKNNSEDFMKLKAAILSVYVNVDGKMKSVNLLPFLTQENLDLIKIPQDAVERYNADKEDIDKEAQGNAKKYGKLTENKKLSLQQIRFKSYIQDLSVRSGPQARDVSLYFPKLTQDEYDKVYEFCMDMSDKHKEDLTQMLVAQKVSKKNNSLSKER